MKQELFGDKKQSDLNLYYVGRDKGVAPGREYGPLIRDCYVVECCTGGEGVNVVNSKSYGYHEGQCVVLFPGDVVIHRTTGTVERTGYWCFIKGLKIHSYLAAAGIDRDHPFVSEQAYPRVLEILKKLYSMNSENDPGAELRRNACIHEMFGEILRHAVGKNDGNAYVRRAMQYIETHYEKNISVVGIARYVGLDRCYFSSLFHKLAGVPPQRYLNGYRIKKACTLLSETAFSIAEIASFVGIAPECFSRVFKSTVGMTPSRYRKINSSAEK